MTAPLATAEPKIITAATQLLREAAALMRERAEACVSISSPHEEPWYEVREDGIKTKWHRFAEANRADAEHIASWHPAVALAVADWLEASADVVEAEDRDRCGPGLGTRRALAVARAYLGSDQ